MNYVNVGGFKTPFKEPDILMQRWFGRKICHIKGIIVFQFADRKMKASSERRITDKRRIR